MDRWDGGDRYDLFMGRWSGLVASRFVDELGVGQGLSWLDVGCGTGALLHAISERATPSRLAGIDPSLQYVEAATSRIDAAADLKVASGDSLPFEDGSFDVVVSGLDLNFIPDPLAAVQEWRRVVEPGGLISAYVWDYAGGMEMLWHFWDAATALDPDARHLDEALRFPLCQPDNLYGVLAEGGLVAVESGSIEVRTVFHGFDDYWDPFLLGQGPAPSYVAGLEEPHRFDLAEELRRRLPGEAGGQIVLTARAWTITGRKPVAIS